MNAAVYAVDEENGVRIYLSLDLRVDRTWWASRPETSSAPYANRIKHRSSDLPKKGLRVLSFGMPLQWASRLAGQSLPSGFAKGKPAVWERWIRSSLRHELNIEKPETGSALLGLEVEPQVQGRGPYEESWSNRQDRLDASDSLSEPHWKLRLPEHADTLVRLMEGRSLLSEELISMLRELAPEMEPHWKPIVQWAYLQRRIKLCSAVGKSGEEQGIGSSFDAGGLPDRLPGKIRLRSAGGRLPAHRCMRCGSEAAGGACAACGSADCARCEACRALGRSRSCGLLLQGPPRAARGGRGFPGAARPGSGPAAASLPQAALRARLARWKLSPAQTAAAELAVRFLEAEPGPARPGRAGRELRRGGGFFAARAETAAAASGGRRPDSSGYAASDPASRFLLWAVTGAGKTEMLFPLIESVRSWGGQVLVATPRRDVVLELVPRLRAAFPDEAPAALYGGSEERWRRSGITLATTHQLMRFAGAFDLVVIDELDAFPFHGDPMLAYAAEKCRAAGGRTVYLSATPPKSLQSLVRSGRLACAKVPVRYHRYPLPVPELLRISPLVDCLRRGSLPDPLLKRWRHSLERGAQIFIFVPKIVQAEPLAALLRRVFPEVPIGATSSQDEERSDKVLSFRSADVRILVTTTILERGVTVPRSDVYVWGADSGLFDEASLVQMAGRAGRSADDPRGRVVFAAVQKTRAQAGARRQIRRMNRLAVPFLLPTERESSRTPKR
ncbi:helicase-related protein [Saccharibacillus qingshengii]|uniref:helicase-related protein n=1 Tax=Saccharibacillus qingshengii TaxID=1763540 RepID=UPI0015530952|nr:helicase-related protein [Saccharibacillus qingshengii]